MKITNDMGLPSPLVDAVKNDSYSSGGADFSVTTLLKPPRIVTLEKEFSEALEEDASDRIWALLGQSIHSILERSGDPAYSERRLFITIDGVKISGQVDYFKDGVVSDYKVTTAWKFKQGEIPPEFIEQCNAYAELLRQNGHEVKRLEIIGILRDFSKLEAMRTDDYPRKQVVNKTVPLWSSEKTMAFLRERVRLHLEARNTLPECSPEERWSKPTKWAVMEKGKERAKKLWDDPLLAGQHAAENKNYFVEVRPGVHTRCSFYCKVQNFCQQYQTLKGENK